MKALPLILAGCLLHSSAWAQWCPAGEYLTEIEPGGRGPWVDECLPPSGYPDGPGTPPSQSQSSQSQSDGGVW